MNNPIFTFDFPKGWHFWLQKNENTTKPWKLSCVLSFEMCVINSKVCKFRQKRKNMELTEYLFANLVQIRENNKGNIHHCEIIGRWMRYLNFWNRQFSIQQEFPVRISCLRSDYVSIFKFFLSIGNLWNIIHIPLLLCYCVRFKPFIFYWKKNTTRFEFVFWYSWNIKYHIDRQKSSVPILFWNIKFGVKPEK